ncbi:LOW QUALITY PROTEIN: hypothetical protein RTBOTA2_001780 [Rhodotorula toruloides]|nr:LOW QUALITY PROTEIN: hypothetical protein RTBOTA2_001780 [Rhodotorula toruloides]
MRKTQAFKTLLLLAAAHPSPRQDPPSMIPGLPYEVFVEVIADIRPHELVYEQDVAWLARLCLVNRGFLEASRRLLYALLSVPFHASALSGRSASSGTDAAAD